MSDCNHVRRLRADLHEALDALAGMWAQYCPPPVGHACMSAGEGAMDVLDKWGLLNADESVDWEAVNRLGSTS